MFLVFDYVLLPWFWIFQNNVKMVLVFFFFLQTHVLKKSKFECFIYSFALDVVLETSFEKLEYA